MTVPKARRCERCKEKKSPVEEHFSKRGKNDFQSYCKLCMKEVRKGWVEENPERATFLRKQARLKKYGIDFKRYAEIWDEQKGCCAICAMSFGPFGTSENAKEMAYIDHDHVTGKVRGLLCNNCNAGLGHFFDTIERLETAINYLRKHSVS